MKKLFWVAIGVGITVLVVVKGRELMLMATPQGVAGQAAKVGRNIEGRVTRFVGDVQTHMSSREAELRDVLGMDAAAESQ